MARQLIVAVPEWHHNPVKPQNYEDFCDMWSAEDHGPLGIWCLKTVDKYTGEVLVEQWRKNVLLDTGATAYLKNTLNNAGSAVAIFNQIAITTNVGATTLTTQLASGGNSPLTVAAVPAAIPANTAGSPTILIIGYGTGQTQQCQVSGAISQNATSIAVQAVGGAAFNANATYAVGTNVLPQPAVGENPSSLGGTVSYSGALSSGAFVFSGSGAGQRKCVASFTFTTTGGATAANYTEAFMVNSNPVSGTGQCAVHVTFMAMAVNASQNGIVTVTELV